MTALRAIIAGLSVAGVGLVAGPGLVRPAPRLLYNATASAPVGFYSLDHGQPRVGDWVAVRPPPGLADWMARRAYLPVNVPLLKRLAATEGQDVCGKAGRVFIDGRLRAEARSRDRAGRPLRPFDGCRRMGPGEVFLLNADAPSSFDGRYFGPLPRTTIIGRAKPLWTERDP